MTEFTLKAIFTGVLLGIVFGAANTYLGLKAGLTISTSIPVAVLSVVAFRLVAALGPKHSILELNMSQTIGSASSSVASGCCSRSRRSRIVGLVCVTSNPTSGMTIATLLLTSSVFLAFGWTDAMGKATALMVGTAVCIAASIAGDTSQDLKTGFILGATPRWQQIGELVGVITSAGFVCLVVMLLHENVEGGLGGAELPAPQAVLMKLVVDGVLDANLPWALIGIGCVLAVIAMFFEVPVLAFAVGVYLPLSTMAAVFCGGLLRWLLTRKAPEDVAESRRERGVLFGSGLVGGGGLTGVLLALWVAARGGERIVGFPLDVSPMVQMVIAAATVGLILWVMAAVARKNSEDTPTSAP